MKRLMFIFLVFPSFAVTCPTSFIAVEYDGFMPATSGACPAGYIAHSNDMICYADLERGNTTDTINVNYNGVVYHTVK